MKKTFNTKVVRSDEFEITIDPQIWDAKKLAEFSRYFFDATEHRELAAHIGFNLTRFGSGKFIEGFGHIKTINEDGSVRKQFIANFGMLKDEDYCPGITIKIISEDEEIETEVKEGKVAA